jgi:RNA ligase (TIGR02306 family)
MRGDEGFRLKTIKLRGEISQGLLLPLAFLNLTGNEQEDDLTELLGVKLYEPDMPAQLAGDVIGLFPSFIPKTDQERVQNLKSILWGGSPSAATMRYEVSEKMDGSSLTVFNFEDSFGVCSRNLQLKESDSNSYWQVVNRYNLKERLAGRNVAIQGELCGEGIQKNKYKLKGQDLFVFDIYSIDLKRYFCPQERSAFMSCVLPGVKTVPILDRGYTLPEDIQGVLEFAQGKSLVNPKQEREGLVFKEELPLQERFSFKAISNKFLLAEED